MVTTHSHDERQPGASDHSRHADTDGRAGGRRAATVAIAASIAVVVAMSAGPVQAHGHVPGNATVADLGTLGGGFSAPLHVNDHGQVIGVSVGPAEAALRGFVWEHGVMSDFGSLGGPQAGAVSINSTGQIGGWSNLDVPAAPSIFNTTELFCNPPMVPGQTPVVCHAVLRDRSRLVDLGTLGGTNSAAENKGINDSGQVVGVAETAATDPTGIPGSHRFHAFMWQRDGSPAGGRMVDLGTLGSDPDSLAVGINNHGQIIGTSVADGATFRGDNGRGFTWNHGRITALKTLGGTFSAPGAINDRGDVVGLSTLEGDVTQHATLWRSGRPIDLGTLPGDGFSEAFDISDHGVIVGTSCGAAGCRAVRWEGRHLTDLASELEPTEQWQLFDAQAVNAHGQIAGDGQHVDQAHGYLLTPR